MHHYYNSEYSASSSTLRLESTPPRRLPSVPPKPSPSSVESRRISRPLPKIPRALTCKQCQAVITSHNVLLPSSQVRIIFPLPIPTCSHLPPATTPLPIVSRLRWESLPIHRNVRRLRISAPFLPSPNQAIFNRFNVKIGKPSVQLMTTGAHTLSEVCCGSCGAYVGWKIVRAHEESERWKEGKFLLELEHLDAQPDPVAPLNLRLQKRSSTDSSGSDY